MSRLTHTKEDLFEILARLAHNQPDQLYRYAMDGYQQHFDRHIAKWEKKESGSLRAVLNAYAYVLDKVWTQAPYTVDDILIIRGKCVADVSGVLHNKEYFFSDKNAHKNFRKKEDGVRFGFRVNPNDKSPEARREENWSKAGIRELAEYCLKHNQYDMFRYADFVDAYQNALIDEEALYEMHLVLPKDEGDYRLENDLRFDALFKKRGTEPLRDARVLERILLNVTDLSENALLKKKLESERREHNIPLKSPLKIYGTENNDSDILTTLVQGHLDSLYEKLKMAVDDRNKIKEIVTTIQLIERIHPFQDANCRTFCLVLLNGLLMQQGFLPSVICNPNKFDLCSVEELVDMVEVGLDITECLMLNRRIQSTTDLFDNAFFDSQHGVYPTQITHYCANLVKKISFFSLILTLSNLGLPEEQNKFTVEWIQNDTEKLRIFLQFLLDQKRMLFLTGNELCSVFEKCFEASAFSSEAFLICFKLIEEFPRQKRLPEINLQEMIIHHLRGKTDVSSFLTYFFKSHYAELPPKNRIIVFCDFLNSKKNLIGHFSELFNIFSVNIGGYDLTYFFRYEYDPYKTYNPYKTLIMETIRTAEDFKNLLYFFKNTKLLNNEFKEWINHFDIANLIKTTRDLKNILEMYFLTDNQKEEIIKKINFSINTLADFQELLEIHLEDNLQEKLLSKFNLLSVIKTIDDLGSLSNSLFSFEIREKILSVDIIRLIKTESDLQKSLDIFSSVAATPDSAESRAKEQNMAKLTLLKTIFIERPESNFRFIPGPRISNLTDYLAIALDDNISKTPDSPRFFVPPTQEETHEKKHLIKDCIDYIKKHENREDKCCDAIRALINVLLRLNDGSYDNWTDSEDLTQLISAIETDPSTARELENYLARAKEIAENNSPRPPL